MKIFQVNMILSYLLRNLTANINGKWHEVGWVSEAETLTTIYNHMQHRQTFYEQINSALNLIL